jgi:hypothetical protein
MATSCALPLCQKPCMGASLLAHYPGGRWYHSGKGSGVERGVLYLCAADNADGPGWGRSHRAAQSVHSAHLGVPGPDAAILR